MSRTPDIPGKTDRPVAVPVPVVRLSAAPSLQVVDGKLVALLALKPAA